MDTGILQSEKDMFRPGQRWPGNAILVPRWPSVKPTSCQSTDWHDIPRPGLGLFVMPRTRCGLAWAFWPRASGIPRARIVVPGDVKIGKPRPGPVKIGKLGSENEFTSTGLGPSGLGLGPRPWALALGPGPIRALGYGPRAIGPWPWASAMGLGLGPRSIGAGHRGRGYRGRSIGAGHRGRA
jgi:hypothetical protein